MVPVQLVPHPRGHQCRLQLVAVQSADDDQVPELRRAARSLGAGRADMLEVGRVIEPLKGAFLSWNRAHFGAWCVTSAPLILGLALTDEKLSPVLEVVTNEEAIAINQAWAGHPGMLVESVYAPPTPYSPAGATLPSSGAGDFELFDGASVTSGKTTPTL